jgi:hypothetical protein
MLGDAERFTRYSRNLDDVRVENPARRLVNRRSRSRAAGCEEEVESRVEQD